MLLVFLLSCCMQWSLFALRGLLRLALFRCRETPAAGPAIKALLLLFRCNRWRILETENLVQWITSIDIVARKPPLTIKWASVLMLTPANAFGWICLNTTFTVA